MPELLADLIILTQIAVFMVTGIMSVLLRHNAWTVLIAIAAGGYGASLYLHVFVDNVTLPGLPSLFLLIFIVLMLREALKKRAKDETPGDCDD